MFISNTVQLEHFCFDNPPESFCRTIIDAMTNTGHGLSHALFLQLHLKYITCILESPVAMKKRFGAGITFKRFIIGIENQLIIISFAYHIGHRTTVIKIQNDAQI